MFKVGISVRYTDPGNWYGSEGVIVETDCPGFNHKEKVHAVNWSSGNLASYQGYMYPGRGFVKNFESTFQPISFQYDPKQAGDTDDDI